MGVLARREGALSCVRGYYQRLGLAGPTVAHATQIIAALDEGGFLTEPGTLRGAVEALRETVKRAEGANARAQWVAEPARDVLASLDHPRGR